MGESMIIALHARKLFIEKLLEYYPYVIVEAVAQFGQFGHNALFLYQFYLKLVPLCSPRLCERSEAIQKLCPIEIGTGLPRRYAPRNDRGVSSYNRCFIVAQKIIL